jgi:S-(hydroxymethyl)glutathione dehydrogenase/alcohol dehydrogenase
MKAAVCTGFGEALVVEELTVRPPSAGEVQVRIAACAICHSDVAFMQGAWEGDLPAVYGHEAAGIVEEVGPGVTGLSAGDRVVVTLISSCGACRRCAEGRPALCERPPVTSGPVLTRQGGETVHQAMRTGAFAEYVTVHHSQLVPIEGGIGPEAASLLACGVLTGVGAAVNTARVSDGSSVVVIGIGGVGLNCVQGAALNGATRIVAVDVVAAKLEAAKSFGATDVVDAGGTDAVETVLQLTDELGADYVFVAAGVPRLVETGSAMLARAGTLVIVGIPPNGARVTLDPLTIADGSQRILGTKMGDSDPGRDIPRLAALSDSGRLKLEELISGRFALEDINEAVASAERGEQLRPVVVFEEAASQWAGA